MACRNTVATLETVEQYLPMEKPAAIQQIRDACNNITRELMRVHPAVPPLADKESQDEIFKTLFELTKNIEIIKKRLAGLEAKDSSTLL